jgi:hypothetical protein
LPHFDPGIGFHPSPINADVTLATHLFDLTLLHLGKEAAEPTIQALIAISLIDF